MIKHLLLFYIVTTHILLVGKGSYFFLNLTLKLKLIKSGVAYQIFTRKLMRKKKKTLPEV